MNDAQTPSERTDIAKALHLAFLLGQTYWQQADSESYSENKKANATFDKFRALVDETVAALSAPASSGASDPEYGYTEAFYEIAALLGFGAQDATPETVFKTQMLPKLHALIEAAEAVRQPLTELLFAVTKHLAALEEEASATMALDNAEANFSDARPEKRRAARAMISASTAAKELRATITAIEAGITGAQE